MTISEEIKERLREIVSQEPWDEDELVELASDIVACDADEYRERWGEVVRRQVQFSVVLKPCVGSYQHDPGLPALPRPPYGQLHGIGFIYDEDRDDRILVAIDNLKDIAGIVALAEHEGVVSIYARLPLGLTSINVCGDEWVVSEFVPFRGRWTEVTEDFMRDCVAQVLKE